MKDFCRQVVFRFEPQITSSLGLDKYRNQFLKINLSLLLSLPLIFSLFSPHPINPVSPESCNTPTRYISLLSYKPKGGL